LKDFTIKTYKELLKAFVDKGFVFSTVHKFRRLDESRLRRDEDVDNGRVIILRQDVDRLLENSLAIARIQKEMGIKSTFYFRSVPQSFAPSVIVEIAGMEHEIGYHYEDLSMAAQKLRVEGKAPAFAKATAGKAGTLRGGKCIRNNAEHGTWNAEPLFEDAIESFGRNLERLRRYADVKTICMNGSPMSRWDSRLLWKYYNCREFGIEVEPYFDLNFEEMLYLTDTGRKWKGQKYSIRDKPVGSSFAKAKEDRGWNSSKVSVRDKVEGGRQKAEGGNEIEHETWNLEMFGDWVVKPIPGSLMNMTEKSTEFQAKYNFRSTNNIIWAAERGELPDRLMMTFHPQRWTDQVVPWVKELVWQTTKNVAKFFLIKIRQ